MKDFNRDINTTTKSYIKLFNFLIVTRMKLLKKKKCQNPIKFLFNLIIN